MTPVRAIFDSVPPAQRQDLPLWLRKATETASEPPESAAALLYSSEDLESHLRNNAALAAEHQFWPFLPPQSSSNLVFERGLLELRDAIASLKRSESELLDELTPHLVRLLQLIAARVLMSEALNDPELPLRLVREGLTQLSHNGHIAVILGSAFEPAVQLLETQLGHEGILCDVQVLQEVSPYTCYVSAQLGFVDASLEARLELALHNFLPRLDGS